MDLVFALDDSSSITVINWNTLLGFVCNNYIQYLNISSTTIRVGMILYDTNARIIFRLTQYNTRSTLTAACNAMTFTGGSTNLLDALTMALTLFQDSPRTQCQKVVVIITDGRSNDPVASTIQGNVVKSAGVKILGVAVVPTTDSAGFKELQQVATSPDEVQQLWVPDFNSLATKLNLLLQYSCLASPVPGKPIIILL